MLNRRGFLGTCAGCAAVCSARAAAPVEEDGPKTKVRVVFTHPPRDKEGWPYVNFDYESKKNETLEKLRSACPYAEFLPASAMNEEEAKLILEKDAEVDGYAVFLLGIPEGRAGRAIAMSGRPAVIVDHLYGGTGAFLFTYGPARREGKPVAGVSSSRFADLAQAVKALDTLTRMKRDVILCVSKRDLTGIGRQIKDVYGTEVKSVTGPELDELYQQASSDGARQWAAKWIAGAEKVVEPSREEIVRSGKMYLAMKTLLDRNRSRAITVDCLDLFYSKQMSAYPCLGFFQLNNDNAVGACEADLTSTSTMLLMSRLIERPGYISDPVIDTAKNQIIYAHCVGTNRVYGPKGPANPYHIRSHSEDRKGAAIRSLPPLGAMTTTLEFEPGAKLLRMHQGRTVAHIDDDKACRTKIAAEVKDSRKLAEEWGGGWHRVTYYGDHRAALDAMAGLLGFRTLVEG